MGIALSNKYFGFTIECNLKQLENYGIRYFDFESLFSDDDFNVIKSIDIFENNKYLGKLPISLYIIFMLGILDCISSNSLNEFVQFIEGNEYNE